MSPTNGQNALAVLAAQKLGNLPANLRAAMGARPADELGGGITSGFAVVSIRGKAWRIKHRGEERTLMREDGDGPRSSIDVVIVKAAPQIAKIWYQSGYVEGSTAPPDCWSVDGIKPDPASPKLQSPTCAGCPQNAWGSAVRPGGSGKGKACADSKRLAIVPEGDMENEIHGGPMLLRVPPASLGAVKQYADTLNAIGLAPFGVVTRMKFDPSTEYPAISFEAVRVLEEDEAETILKHRASPLVERILNTAIDHVETDGTDKSHVGPTPPLQVAPVRPTEPVRNSGNFTVPLANAAGPWPDKPVTPPHDPVTGEIDPLGEGSKDGEQAAWDHKAALMRQVGLGDVQIEAAIGKRPVIKEEPKEDPRIAQLRAVGLSDDQIAAALGVTPRGSDQPQSVEARAIKGDEQPQARRGRKPKAAAAPAEEAPQEPVQAAPEEPKAQEPQTEEPASGDLPADFEAALRAMLPPGQPN
jgi:hypothetical protein